MYAYVKKEKLQSRLNDRRSIMSQETGCNETIAVTSVTITLFFSKHHEDKISKTLSYWKKNTKFLYSNTYVTFFCKTVRENYSQSWIQSTVFCGEWEGRGKGSSEIFKMGYFFFARTLEN